MLICWNSDENTNASRRLIFHLSWRRLLAIIPETSAHQLRSRAVFFSQPKQESRTAANWNQLTNNWLKDGGTKKWTSHAGGRAIVTLIAALATGCSEDKEIVKRYDTITTHFWIKKQRIDAEADSGVPGIPAEQPRSQTWNLYRWQFWKRILRHCHAAWRCGTAWTVNEGLRESGKTAIYKIYEKYFAKQATTMSSRKRQPPERP